MTTRPETAPIPAPACAPTTHGVALDQSFFSLDPQAGRPLALALIGRLSLAEARDALAACGARADDLARTGADLVALVELHSPHALEVLNAAPPGVRVIFSSPEVFAAWGFPHRAAVLVGLDGGARLLDAPWLASEAAFERLLAAFRALPREAPFDDAAPAPVLVVPNILSADLCRELVAHFEASEPVFGGMASVDENGAFVHKVEAGKKHRYDLVLGPRDRYLNRVMAGVATRVIPEIKKAFQVEICHTDRILLARYDETGGYFRRHRDNAAPSVAFRQFALSINLNDDFDGGQVLFPEYNLRRYRPRAGSGVVFSCSLLHEAAAVTRGRRYCALTFLHDAAAQARWLAESRRAS